MIEKLTKKQEEEVPQYIEKYLKLVEKPTDRKKATAAIQALYESAKFKKPIVIFGKNPIQTAIMVAMCKILFKEKFPKDDSQLDSQLSSQLDSQLRSQLSSQLSKINNDWWIIVWWLAWAGWYAFAKYIGVKFDNKVFKVFMDFVENVSFIIPYEGIAFVSETPQKVSWNNKLLHSDVEPAVKYDGDYGLYSLNGVRFEKELWEKVVSRKMSFKEVMEIQDIDQRTQAMAYCPPREFLENEGKLLEKSEKGNELWFIPKEKGLFRIDAYFL